MTQLEVHVTGGVDTHKETHVAAALDQLGRTVGTESFPATAVGYRQLLSWLTGFVTLDSVGIEGTGAWGAGLARFLTANDLSVIEVRRPNRQHRRRYDKSDDPLSIVRDDAIQHRHVVEDRVLARQWQCRCDRNGSYPAVSFVLFCAETVAGRDAP